MGADWQLPVFGLIVGTLVGLTGVGGGVLMTPLLTLVVGVPPMMAVGTDLAYNTLTKLAGTWQHWRQGTVDARVVRGLAIGSLPASAVAIGLLVWLRGRDEALLDVWLPRAIGLTLVIAAGLMLWRSVLRRGAGGGVGDDPTTYPTFRLAAIGALGGFLVGVTSIGSGSLIIALLVMTISLRPERLVGTDIAHAFLLVGVAALGHWFFLDDVDMSMAAKLLVGSVPGVLIGSRLTVWVPRRPLQIGLAALLLSSAYRLLL